MTLQSRNPQPAVLRCARCGRFVNWHDARVQVVDNCRPYIELPPVLVRSSHPEERPAVLELFRRDFGHTNIHAFGELVPLEQADVVVAEMKGELAGALAYRLTEDAVYMLALATDPMWQRSGVGGHLVADVELLSKQRNVRRALMATTNDNLPALYFYQRRGYHLVGMAPRPPMAPAAEIGQPGFAGIAVTHEIRLEKQL
jgi:ribosomal protein S18 acetylase RimI-like enzyme